MILALNGIIPPKEWYHNPNIKCDFINKEGKLIRGSVEDYLEYHNIPVPQEWQCD